jgi:hypothetical protein
MWSLAVLMLLALADQSFKDQVLSDDFESTTTVWIEESGDASRTVRHHERSAITAHAGRLSERIALTAGSGSHVHYAYAIPRAVLFDELQASLWIKADRPGVQLLARVTFPRERNPETLQLLGVVVAGTTYRDTGRWELLELKQLDAAVDKQLQLLRASLRRNVDTRDAYIDRLLLNVYAGPGATELFVDDLEVRPILGEPLTQAQATLREPAEPAGPRIEIAQDRIEIDGRPRLLRTIHAPGIAPATLKEFGFNVLSVEWPLDLARIEAAVNRDLWLQAELPPLGNRTAADVLRAVSELPFRDSVLDWYLGTGLGEPEADVVTEVSRLLKSRPPRRPIAGDLAAEFRRYSRDIEMLGVHRQPIGTSIGIGDYRDWLAERRYLARPGSYFWTWIQAAPAGSGNGPDPDQIRLLTYAAIAAGYRGFGFWADRTLGQPGMGRQRLLALGLLNLELQILEPFLAPGGPVNVVQSKPDEQKQAETTVRFGASKRENRQFRELTARHDQNAPRRGDDAVEAAVIRTDRGVVVLPVWYGSGSQFVAGQSAANELNLVVEGVSETAQAWQVTPVDVRLLKSERLAGGMRVTLPEFDLTGIVLLTSDARVLDELRKEVTKTRPWAAVWAAELAAAKLESVRDVDRQLVAAGHALPDGAELAEAAQRHMELSRAALQRAQYDRSYAEAQRAIRALRLIQRAHWEAAVKGLGLPQTSPYAVSFQTLPEHWQFMREASTGTYGSDLIPAGDFESAEAVQQSGWTQQPFDGPDTLEFRTSLSSREPHGGRYDLHLRVEPKPDATEPGTLEHAWAALTSQAISLNTGDVLRIRFWLRIPQPIRGGLDGAVVYDSLGGRALAVTRHARLEWKQFELYRRADRPTSFTFTIALAGAGDLHVDDLSIQRLVAGPTLTRKATDMPR